MTLITEPILALEAIQRTAFLILFDQLNGAVDQINTFMATDDEELDNHLGRPYVPTVIELIEAGNFYEGHRPSLIDAAVEKYPNCSVWGVRTVPAPESSTLDQISISQTLLYIELMARSSPEEGEGIVNRRLLRMAEGVNLCVMSNPTLRGLVNGRESDPTVNVSEVFTRKERTAYGPHWFWQGARVEFTVRKEAVLPTGAGVNPAGSILRTLHGPTVPLGTAQPETGIPGVPDFDYANYIDQG